MEEKQQSSNKKIIVILIIIIFLLLAGGAVWFFFLRDKPADNNIGGQLTSESNIPYETNVGLLKPNEDWADQLKEGADDRIPLHFSTSALSEDGENFQCVLGNPAGARYDVYFDIYADADMTQQIYISGLVPPGSQLEGFKTNTKFPQGSTDVVLAVTQVEDDHKTLVNQTFVYLTLYVK